MKNNEIFAQMSNGEWKAKPYQDNFIISTNSDWIAEVNGGKELLTDIAPKEGIANVEAIVTAVNETYGKGIDPACVSEMFYALKAFLAASNATKDRNSRLLSAAIQAKSAIEKATITKSETVTP